MQKYIKGDIHEKIKELPDNSIDLIYTDPPFNVTNASWERPLNWAELFPEMWRVLKPTGIIILYASMPFTYELLQYDKPKYHYTWIKNNSTGFLCTKYQPLRTNEEIFIYYKKNGTYNPQMKGDKFMNKRNVKFGGDSQYWGGSDKKNVVTKEGGHKGKFPTTDLYYPIRKGKCGITRCDEMIEYFIKTYSNEDDTILDMTCHNKICGDICINLNRSYVGIDLMIDDS